FAEAKVVLLLVLQDAFRVLGVELAAVDQDGAERTGGTRRRSEHRNGRLHACIPGRGNASRDGGWGAIMSRRRKTGRREPAGLRTPITGTPGITIRSSGRRMRRSSSSRPSAARMPAASAPRREPTMPTITLGREGSSGSTAGLSRRVLAWLFWPSMLTCPSREATASYARCAASTSR